jgi:hypothetical protein
MAYTDLLFHAKSAIVLSNVEFTDNTPQSGVVDTEGFGSVTFVAVSGTIADADCTFTPSLEDSPDGITYAAVGDAWLINSESGPEPAKTAIENATFTDDTDSDKVKEFGYNASLRNHVKYTLTPAGNAASARFTVIAILGHPRRTPIER